MQKIYNYTFLLVMQMKKLIINIKKKEVWIWNKESTCQQKNYKKNNTKATKPKPKATQDNKN
jgi:hypothetical protein